MTYGTAESEAIGLCISLEAIDDIANAALLELRDVSEYPGEVEVYFHSHVHQHLFLIRLLDFVKENSDRELTGVAGSCLQVLKQAAATRSFDQDGSISALEKSVEDFEHWLSYRRQITLWLPTLDREATVDVSRLEFLSISGNHLKHNLSRLTRVSRDIAAILHRHGYDVPVEHVPLALDDFREHLTENYFLYYGTWLAELLNNLRWGLNVYLEPTFKNSWRKGAETYSYKYPDEIRSPVAQQWFWRLMNNVRRRPYLKRFSGAHYFKRESSLEWQR